MLKSLLIIGTGSFVGGVVRYLLSRVIQNNIISVFPYGTFVVNVLGCFIIGLVYAFANKGNIINAEWRMFLTVGFCGGFTTFSTFANENLLLLKQGEFMYFAMYTSISVFACLIATYLGSLVTK